MHGRNRICGYFGGRRSGNRSCLHANSLQYWVRSLESRVTGPHERQLYSSCPNSSSYSHNLEPAEQEMNQSRRSTAQCSGSYHDHDHSGSRHSRRPMTRGSVSRSHHSAPIRPSPSAFRQNVTANFILHRLDAVPRSLLDFKKSASSHHPSNHNVTLTSTVRTHSNTHTIGKFFGNGAMHDQMYTEEKFRECFLLCAGRGGCIEF